MKKSKQGEVKSISFEIGKEEIIFKVGDESFSMDAEKFLTLIDFNYMRNAFAGQLTHEDDDPVFCTPENFATIGTLLGAGMNYDEISQSLGMPVDKVRSFYTKKLVDGSRFDKNPTVISKRGQLSKEIGIADLNRKLSLAEEQSQTPPDVGYRELYFPEIKRLLKQLSPKEVALKLNLDEKTFKDWLERNEKYLACLR